METNYEVIPETSCWVVVVAIPMLTFILGIKTCHIRNTACLTFQPFVQAFPE